MTQGNPPLWLHDLAGPDLMFWVGYLTNGKHMGWYASLQATVFVAMLGAALALIFGLLAAALGRAGAPPLRWIATGYINVVRGVPDVLFFLFFPLAFEQAVEWFWAQNICTPETLAANSGQWPPCDAANWRLTSGEYVVMAAVALGIVYGAFAANVIAGALAAIPKGQIEAARAFGFTRRAVLFCIELKQMWIYALPGLGNVWLLLVKATSLLSLLQIVDFVAWAQRLGATNTSPFAGVVHEDWRWRYYLVVLAFYLLVTFLSEKGFAALSARVGRGMVSRAGAP